MEQAPPPPPPVVPLGVSHRFPVNVEGQLQRNVFGSMGTQVPPFKQGFVRHAVLVVIPDDASQSKPVNVGGQLH